MTRFIMRVDDVGQAPEQHKPDRGLAFFRSWWDAGGWGEEPIYLGVVPGILSPVEMDMLFHIEDTTEATLSVHGWDHAKQILQSSDISRALDVMPRARTVIPPFNLYDENTIRYLGRRIERPVLLGGFHEANAAGREADHPYGPAPVVVDGVLHLSAGWLLYEHCYRMVEAVESFPDPGYPVVVTAHLRWDIDFFPGVRALREALAGRLVSVDEAWP